MKKVFMVFIALLMLITSSTGLCWALTPNNLPGSGAGTGTGTGTGAGAGAGVGPGTTGNVSAGVDTNINNTTNTNNSADTNINISGSTISNSNIGSNNTINQTTKVTNTNTVEVKQYVTVMVNGQPLQSDVPSFINGDNRTMVTLRAIAEALGAKVDWDPATQTITITLGDKVVKLVIGQNTYTVNGQEKTMDTAPAVSGGRTVVPARVVGEAFGANVGWKPEDSTVTVDTGSQSGQQTGQTTQPSQQTGQNDDWKKKFPISKEQRDSFDDPQTVVLTSATLKDTGLFSAKTTMVAIRTSPLSGMTGNNSIEAKVQLKDASGSVVFSDGKTWEVTESTQEEDWSINVPADVMPKVAEVAIVHNQVKKMDPTLSASDRNDNISNKSYFHMDSFGTLDLANGYLLVQTKTWNDSPLTDFVGAVQAGVYDSKGTLIWKSGVHTFSVGVKDPAGLLNNKLNFSRVDTWNETAPSDILSEAVRLEIRHGNQKDTESGNGLF